MNALFLWTLNKCGPRSNDSYARGEACLFWRPAQKTDFCISCGRFQSNWFLVKTCRLWRGEASTRRLGVMWSRTSERSSETRCNWKKTSSLGLWKFRTCQYQLINWDKKKTVKSKQACFYIVGTSVMEYMWKHFYF